MRKLHSDADMITCSVRIGHGGFSATNESFSLTCHRPFVLRRTSEHVIKVHSGSSQSYLDKQGRPQLLLRWTAKVAEHVLRLGHEQLEQLQHRAAPPFILTCTMLLAIFCTPHSWLNEPAAASLAFTIIDPLHRFPFLLLMVIKDTACPCPTCQNCKRFPDLLARPS